MPVEELLEPLPVAVVKDGDGNENDADKAPISVSQLDVTSAGPESVPSPRAEIDDGDSDELDNDDDPDDDLTDEDDLGLDLLGLDEVALSNPIFSSEPSEDDRALDEVLFGDDPVVFEMTTSIRPAATLGKALSIETPVAATPVAGAAQDPAEIVLSADSNEPAAVTQGKAALHTMPHHAQAVPAKLTNTAA